MVHKAEHTGMDRNEIRSKLSMLIPASSSELPAAEEDENAGEDYLHAVNRRAVKWFGRFTSYDVSHATR
jgi:hypothetical protein